MCNPANYCLNIVKLVRCTLICQTVCKHRAPGKLIANLWLRHGHPPRAAVSILTNHYPIHVFYSSVKLFSSSLNLKGTHFSRSIFFGGGGGWRKGKIATTNFSSTWIVSNKGTQTFIRECTKEEEEEKRKKSSMILPQIAANSSFRNCDDLVAPALYRQKQRVRG